MEQRTCHICGTVTGAKDDCPTCLAAFPNRRDVKMMTIDERIAELELWYGVLEIPFDMLQQRIEELMGRSVWTHELVDPDALYDELRNGRTVTMNDIIGKVENILGKDKVIVIDAGEER